MEYIILQDPEVVILRIPVSSVCYSLELLYNHVFLAFIKTGEIFGKIFLDDVIGNIVICLGLMTRHICNPYF